MGQFWSFTSNFWHIVGPEIANMAAIVALISIHFETQKSETALEMG